MECRTEEIISHMVFRKIRPSGTKRWRSHWALVCPGSKLRMASYLAVLLGFLGAFMEYVREHDFMGLDKHFRLWAVGFKGFKVFSTLVGFLVVFKNSKAYYNYWNACKLLQQQNAAIYNSFSSCVAFSRTSKADAGALADYQLSIATYFSLLTAVCFQRLVCSETDLGISEHTNGLPDFNVLGMQAFTEEHLLMLRTSGCSPALVVHWIHSCVIEHIDKKVLDLHPALLTRIFDFLHKGFMAYEDLLKVVSYPFPVTYSAAALWLMTIDAMLTPLAVIGVVHHPATAFLLTFTLVFVFQALFVQAMSLSNPFQIDEINLNELMSWQNSKYCRVLDAAAEEWQGCLHRDGEPLLDHGPLSRIHDEHSSNSECSSNEGHIARFRTAFLKGFRRN